MGNKFLHRLVAVLIPIAMIVGLLFSLWVMANVDVAMRHVLSGQPHWYMTVWYALCIAFLIGAEMIAVQLLIMLRSVNHDPFIPSNVSALRRMGFIALGMTCIGILIGLYPLDAWLITLISAIVALCGLFSLVLAEVFAAAVAHKQELDWTV